MAKLITLTAPGVAVNVSTTSGGAGNPAPNATAFVVGISDRGTTVPTQVLDFLDYQSKYGGRSGAAAILSDSVEEIFAEGGSAVYVNRVVGTTPTYGTLALLDRAGTPLLTMTVNSKFYGAQSANLTVSITASANGVANTFDVNVFDSTSSTPAAAVEIWRDNPDVATAVSQINTSSVYLTAVNNASGSTGLLAQPAILAATALSAGTDDRGTIVDASWNTAASAFNPNLGPGLLLAPGRTTTPVHLALEATAAASGRFALLDGPDQPSAGAITSLAATDSAGTGLNVAGDCGMIVTPWVVIPPAPGGSAVRPVPGSAFMAGLIARNDALAGHSNQASMGIFGNAAYAVGLSGVGFTEAERTTINGRQGTTGASVIRSIPGAPCQAYGFRTVSTSANSYFAANIRETLALRYLLALAGDNYVGRMIDGRGLLFADVNNDLTAILTDAWNKNALYGASAQLAFSVDTGPTVNTPSTIAAGLIQARIWFIPSPTGERVIFNLQRQGVTG